MLIFWILLAIWLCLVLIFSLSIWRDEEFRNDRVTEENKWFYIVLTISPINIILVILLLVWTTIEKMFKIMISTKEKRERKIKIKEGTIRITKEDPYGEEDWSS
jgi:heme/copper-type cytochrome/quinol oxidase subunit 2